MVLNKSLSKVAWILALVGVIAGCSSGPVRVPETPPVSPPPVTPEAATRAPRLGLALGGGAARGFAHVGVIQVLEQNGIRPDLVVGTSAGSMVAAMYASGKTAAELEATALSMEEATLTDWSLPIMGRGMLRGEALTRYVRQAVGGKLLENMSIPLGVLATDLATGQGVLFRRGDAAQAVRASSAVPGVFAPVNITGRDYVDGGLVAPVPVRYARDMGAEVVLAVDISSAPEGNSAVGSVQALLQTFAIMGQSIHRHEPAGGRTGPRPPRGGGGRAGRPARPPPLPTARPAPAARLA
ncbi:MAG: patatin-like phospholipase family protein, partial [Hydrogenophaga sp.]|uniref:patatin-like phospholipase family protein n=1 Tax=Hydrogenophaga sp. TaxID=1904254 RepID=UPI0025B8A84E